MAGSFVENINLLASKLPIIEESNEIFDEGVIPILEEISKLDLDTAMADLKKGTYLGNRKLDINLILNMLEVDENLLERNPDLAETIWTDVNKAVHYDKAIITFVDGVEIELPFMFDGSPVTVTTHGDLLAQLSRLDYVYAKAQIDSIYQLTVGNSTDYTVTIDATPYTFTSDLVATRENIVAGIANMINSASVPVTALVTDNGTKLNLIAKVPGNPFYTSVSNNMSINTIQVNVIEGPVETAFLAKLENTLAANFAEPVVGEIVRLYDVIGLNSNVERIRLNAVSGSYKTQAPEYYWANSTSSFQTLSMRANDIIKLGAEIDNIILLAKSIEEVIEIQKRIPQLVDTYDVNNNPNGDETIYNNLSELVEVHSKLSELITVYNDLKIGGTNYIQSIGQNLQGSNTVNTVGSDLQLGVDSKINITGSNIDKVTTLSDNITNVNTVASANSKINLIVDTVIPNLPEILLADDNAQIATNKALEATQAAAIATAKNAEMKNVSVGTTITGIPGTPANVTYNPVSNKFTFVIPKGDKGDKGDAFLVNAIGLKASQSLYDSMIEGFSFLAIDESKIYFKMSNATGDWSLGSPFGKGDKGDKGDTGNSIVNTVFTSTTDPSGLPGQSGATDTYTINYDNLETDTFIVKNGEDGLNTVIDTLEFQVSVDDVNYEVSVDTTDGIFEVYFNGMLLPTSDYTLTGSSVIVNKPVVIGDEVIVKKIASVDVLNTYSQSAINTKVTEAVLQSKNYTDTGMTTVVKLTGNQTIDDVKTFTSSPIVPTPLLGSDAVNKNYVDEIKASLNDYVSVQTAYHIYNGSVEATNTILTNGFSTTLHTGNGTTQDVITGVDMTTKWGDDVSEKFGGLVWMKGRSLDSSNRLVDTVRGINKNVSSNHTSTEMSNVGIVSSFNNDGFSLSGTYADSNQNLATYASWNFQTTHRVSGVTNHGKSYTCHYNPYTGFTIVKYEGSGIAGHEIPHHLGRKLGFVTAKNLTVASSWATSREDGKYLGLNEISAELTLDVIITLGIDYTVLGANDTANKSTNQYIMYGWANSYLDESNKLIGNYEIGVYLGTGVVGNKVTTRGKPAWVMIKRLDSTGDWYIHDNKRNDFHNRLATNLSNVENADLFIDDAEDGFIVNNTNAVWNASGGQYLYMVVYDNDSGSGKSKYPKATDATNLSINALVPYVNGSKVSIEYKNETITGLTLTEGNNYLYSKNDGTYGVSKYEPMYGALRNRSIAGENPDYFDLGLQKWFSTTGGSELVTNGTFTTNTTGWTAQNGATLSVDNSSLKIVRGSGNYVVSQTISTIIGTTYKFKCYLSKTTGNSIAIFITDSSSNNIIYDSTTSSKQVELTFIARSSTTNVTFHIDGNAGSIAYVDNISVFETKPTIGAEITPRTYLDCVVYADNNGQVSYVEELPKIEYKDVIKANEFKGKNACTAWVNFDGTTTPPTIRDSYNVSKVIRFGTGNFDIYFQEPMDNIAYVPVMTGDYRSNVYDYSVNSQNFNSFKIADQDISGNGKNGSNYKIVVFGGKN